MREGPKGGSPEGEEEPDMEQLLSRFHLKDGSARRTLVERYRDRVWRMALTILGNEQAAWDVAQEVFVRVLTRDARFTSTPAFEAWLYRLTYNAAMDSFRRNRRWRGASEEAIESREAPLEEPRFERREQRDAVSRVLSMMPAKYRAALAMREMEGMTPERMSKALGIPQGLVRWRVFRARALFRDIWEREYGRFED